MLLAEILKILAAQTETLGYRRADLYEKLFQGILDDNSFGMDDIVKQIFSGSRPLNSALMRELCGSVGFQHLCDNIQANLLAVVGNHSGLYGQFARLLTDCPYTSQPNIEKIMAACDPAQAAELSRFIAACIVCGSYNTAQHKKKARRIQDKYALSVEYMSLDTPAAALTLKTELWTAAQSNYIASHREGGRFQSRGKTEDGTVAPLAELCARSDADIAIIGDGGIGKTTFLQHR